MGRIHQTFRKLKIGKCLNIYLNTDFVSLNIGMKNNFNSTFSKILKNSWTPLYIDLKKQLKIWFGTITAWTNYPITAHFENFFKRLVQTVPAAFMFTKKKMHI